MGFISRARKKVKSSVKKANDLSPEGLQLQREMWLENRRILNDVINDTDSQQEEQGR